MVMLLALKLHASCYTSLSLLNCTFVRFFEISDGILPFLHTFVLSTDSSASTVSLSVLIACLSWQRLVAHGDERLMYTHKLPETLPGPRCAHKVQHNITPHGFATVIAKRPTAYHFFALDLCHSRLRHCPLILALLDLWWVYLYTHAHIDMADMQEGTAPRRTAPHRIAA